MSAPRDVIIDGLAAFVGPGLALEGVNVIGYARGISAPAVPTVLVRLDEVVPHPSLPQAKNLYRFALILVTPFTEAGPADDDLDEFLEDVLFAIARTGDLTWTKATRGTYQDTTYPAYEVALDVPINKESS